MKISIIAGIAFVFHLNSLFAQDPQFTQHFSVGIYNNPAFTGSAGKARLTAAYRNQWTSLSGGGFNTSFLSFDISKEKLPVDIGIFSMHDRAGGGTLNTTQLGISLGRGFKIFKNISLRIGLSGAIANRRLNTKNLIFAGNIDPIFNSQFYNSNYAIINYGMILHSRTFLLGFSANNLNEPYRSFYLTNSRLPIRYIAQGAVRVTPENPENLSGLFLTINYLKQSEFTSFLPGLSYRYKSIKAGLAVRDEDAFIANAAFSGKKLSIGYSYDYTISKLTNQTGGSHEITLNFTFGKLNEKRPGISFISSLF